jgi:hypothetical protein
VGAEEVDEDSFLQCHGDDGHIGDDRGERGADPGPAAVAERFGYDEGEQGPRSEPGRLSQDESLEEKRDHGKFIPWEGAFGSPRAVFSALQVVDIYQQ